MSEALIVVGVDGSELSRQALRWAIEESRLRGARLLVVHAWWVYPMLGAGLEIDPDVDDANDAVRSFVAETVGEQGEVEFETLAVQGAQASAALIDAAENADLLVVGSRGAGGFSSLLLGSVSQQVAHHAPCPVVIVR